MGRGGEAGQKGLIGKREAIWHWPNAINMLFMRMESIRSSFMRLFNRRPFGCKYSTHNNGTPNVARFAYPALGDPALDATFVLVSFPFAYRKHVANAINEPSAPQSPPPLPLSTFIVREN